MPYAPGSHLVSSRFGYTHHGIYVGNGEVVHYLLDEGVTLTDLEEFSCGNAVWVRTHPGAPYSGEECARRALSRLGEDEYNLVFNNCEHFATWCATGKKRSPQVERAVCGVAAAAATAAVRTTATTVVRTTLCRAAGTALAAGGTGALLSSTGIGSAIATGGVALTGTAAAAALAPVAIGVGLAAGIGALLDWWD